MKLNPDDFIKTDNRQIIKRESIVGISNRDNGKNFDIVIHTLGGHKFVAGSNLDILKKIFDDDDLPF